MYPLRGGNEKSGNPGNVLSLLKLMKNHNEILRIHLEAPQMRRVTFMSPQTQNELLEVVAKRIILQGIVQDVKQARFCSIMADEVASHNSITMHWQICVRFIDPVNDIREEFLQFRKLTRITGKHIAEEIVKSIEDLGIPVEDMRGQGYGGPPIYPANASVFRHVLEKSLYLQHTFIVVGTVSTLLSLIRVHCLRYVMY